jgi:hypothetical protein
MQNDLNINKPQDTKASARRVPGQKRYKLLACEIIYRELCILAGESEHQVDVCFLEKALHDAGKGNMCRLIQNAINEVKPGTYDAIILGYARCNDGVEGLQAPDIPLVIPRAHDCITFFFGSDQAYQEFFTKHPGTYFRSTGWTERGDYDMDTQTGSVMAKLGLDRTYEEYVAQYGKENAEFIISSMGHWQQHYEQIAYMDMGLPQDELYARLAREEAIQRKLKFCRIKGDWSLLRNLVNGPWDEKHFLVVPPRGKVISDNDGHILTTLNT